MDRIKTGSLIREQRRHLNLTQEELAARLAISTELLESYENGTALFRASMLKKLATELGLSLFEIMHGEKVSGLSSRCSPRKEEENGCAPVHSIRIAALQTIYGYQEHYWLIDGEPIVSILERWVQEGRCPNLEIFCTVMGLLPAWTGKLLWASENRFVWEMIDSPDPLNVPLLVCEEDCDFSCIVILVRIRKTENFVFWEKLGLLSHENEDGEKEKCSGILCLEAYTANDWEQYGDNIATERCGSPEYWQWVSAHWDEELIRRRRNYTLPYMQDENNIVWIASPGWKFPRAEYDRMVVDVRRIYQENASR